MFKDNKCICLLMRSTKPGITFQKTMYLKYHCLKECKHERDHEKNELLRFLRDDTFGKTF